MEILNNIKDLFIENWIGQTVGLIAFIISIYNFTFCKNKKFVFITMVVSLIWGVHFFSIGLLAGAFINFVDVIKNALALKYEKSKYLAILFVLIYIGVGIITYQGPISIIPAITGILSTFLVFYIRGVWLNIGFLFIVGLWMSYNYSGGSIGGLSTDITLFFSGIIGIIRILSEEKKSKKNNIEKIEEKQIKKEIENI